MKRDEKAVYITFDDGPIPQATPWILDTLDHYGIKATFFMVGDNVRKYPELFADIKRRGHSVGNHTFNLKNVRLANELIQTKLFRPPHGWMRRWQYLFLRHKYTIIMWDLVTRDYSKWIDAEDVVENVKKYARNGSIIEKLKTALPRCIEWLREQGYEFKKFDENMKWSRHLK